MDLNNVMCYTCIAILLILGEMPVKPVDHMRPKTFDSKETQKFHNHRNEPWRNRALNICKS